MDEGEEADSIGVRTMKECTRYRNVFTSTELVNMYITLLLPTISDTVIQQDLLFPWEQQGRISAELKANLSASCSYRALRREKEPPTPAWCPLVSGTDNKGGATEEVGNDHIGD